jgi:phosphate/sulfate permease
MYMKDTFKKRPEGYVLLALSVAAIIFFSVTNPARVPPIVFMIGFGLLLGIVYCGVRLIARLGNLKARLTSAQYAGFVFSATVVPVLLIALQSLGQLTVRDAVTLLLIFGIGYFYISRMSARHS